MVALFISFSSLGFGQGALALSSGTAAADGSVTLALTLTSPTGSEPAAIQWSFAYSASDIVSITAARGPVADAAGKSISCAASSGSYLCLLAGLNVNRIENGVVAVVTLKIAAGTASATIGVANALGATADGYALPITGAGGAVTGSAPAAPPTLTALTCSPDESAAGALSCTVQLSQAAPAGGTSVLLQSNSSRVQAPGELLIPAGSQSATFTASVAASDQDEQPQITASVQGSSRMTAPTIIGIRPTSLKCSASEIQAGNWLDCEVQLNSTNVPEVARLALSTSNPDVRIPATITTRPGQTRLTFRTYVDPGAQLRNSNLTAQFGATAVNAALFVTPSPAPILSIPGEVETAFGELATFTVSAVSPTGLTVVLSAADLPDGAAFNPATGNFSWIPTPSEQGSYSLAFTATDSAAAAASGHVTVVVDSGKPVITGVQNAGGGQPACSPGSLAALTGRWLASGDGPVSDPSGTALELGGTRVKLNGEYVGVAYASPGRVDFVCPQLAPGTPLLVSAENDAGAADPASTTMYASSPGIFSLDGSGTGQAMITLAGTSLLAASRDYRALGQPAEPGDAITIRMTGIGALGGALPTVRIGGFTAQVESVQDVPGAAGVYEITVDVPPGVQEGTAIPVTVSMPGGRSVARGPLQTRDLRDVGTSSNAATIAIEIPRL